MDNLQLQYLEAMGIPAWEPRDSEASAPDQPPEIESSPAELARPPTPDPVSEPNEVKAGSTALVQLGPGDSSRLFVIDGQDATAGKLAADLARALGEQPVWAWRGSQEQGATLESAISEKLFTSVVVFGHALAVEFGVGGGATSSARIIAAPSLERIARDPVAKKECWAALKAAGLVARQ